MKRERQLKAQIETLINDSLGLLKSRLHELGIQAKNSPEFIDKAKGIVCNHHDLQRRKTNLEQEVRQLEIEGENLARVKEQELSEKLLRDKNGVLLSQAQIKDIVQKEIDAILKSKPLPRSKGPPMLNKLSDVTFTKCGEQVTTQIRKRSKEMAAKQRDWPEKRRRISSTEWKDPGRVSPQVKIEEKNPELLARKIIEQGRNLERKTSAATLTISPTKGHGLPPHQNYTSPAEIRKIDSVSPSYSAARRVSLTSPPGSMLPPSNPFGGRPQQLPPTRSLPMSSASPIVTSSSSSLSVALPKVDLSATMQASSSRGYPPMALPPHPESRSRSSEQTAEELSFGKSKMSSTPRAEQFEDRLKTIIHSVLSSDPDHAEGHPSVPLPPPPNPAYLSRERDPGMPPVQPAAYDLVKREHPPHPSPHVRPPAAGNSHVPHPPARSIPYPRPPMESGYPHRPPSPSYSYSGPASSHHPPSSHMLYGGHPPHPSHPGPPLHYAKMRPREESHHPHPSKLYPPQRYPYTSHSTMSDLISSEIERNMTSPSSSAAAHPPSHPHSSSRIYDRYEPRHVSEAPPHHLQLPPRPMHRAADVPPTMARMSQVIEDSVRGSHLPSASLPPGARGPPVPLSAASSHHSAPPPPMAHRPELEGLACPRRRSPPPPPVELHYQHRRVVPEARDVRIPLELRSPRDIRAQPPEKMELPRSSRNDYPAMEGLAARFGPYMEKASREEPLATSSYRGFSSRSPPPSSSPYEVSLRQHQSGRDIRQAHSPPRLPSPPALPPKKQYIDEGADYRMPKGKRCNADVYTNGA